MSRQPYQLDKTRRYGMYGSYAHQRGSKAVPCPECGHTLSTVVDSRPTPDGRCRRRRCCTACELRFTTYEAVALEQVIDYQI